MNRLVTKTAAIALSLTMGCMAFGASGKNHGNSTKSSHPAAKSHASARVQAAKSARPASPKPVQRQLSKPTCCRQRRPWSDDAGAKSPG